MSKDVSYRQILRSTSIIGGASVINIVVGLLRVKVAAVLLGPTGVGLIGLLTNLAGTASGIAGLGFGTVGTRQIAEAVGSDDVRALAAVRRALFWGTMALALFGALVFWFLRDYLAVHVLGNASLASDVGWLSLMVGLTVAAASQTALLNGMRKIGDLARVSVFSSLLATLLGVGALLIWGSKGLMAFVLAGPLASLFLGYWYVARLPKINAPRTPLPELADQWRRLATLGAAFVVAGLANSLGQLLVRTLVRQQMGADQLGYFQAASTISLTYLGFVLGAMGSDYYPRLTAVIHDHKAVNRMVNEQTEVALLLAGPVFLAMMGLAPWVIDVLYAHSFRPASDALRWMVLGDVLKVASWPLGYIILAAGDGRTFMVTESLAMGTFVLLTWLGLSWLGIVATGIAFVGMYALLLPIVYWLAKRKTGFKWSLIIWKMMLLLIMASLIIFSFSLWSIFAGAVVGLSFSIGYVFYSASVLINKTNITNSLLRKLIFYPRILLIKFGMWHE